MSQKTNQAKKTTKPKKVVKPEPKELIEKHLEKPMEKINPEDVIFALDIGTRTVVGIAGIEEDSKFRVLAAEVLEHQNRAMLDGQIHDIKLVADIAQEVKSLLEKKLNLKLTKVAIAAAGRVLRTCEVRVEREIEVGREIDQEVVSSLEMEGIQVAQLRLDEEIVNEEKTQFYCVGYSVINYYLNGYVISALPGHKGKKIGVDILATFLPHIVVDSLYTVMSRIGLEVVSLTLEPIAAINVTIPKDLRLLNLALVDIGAGTSDIAITRDGSVVAYGMAPVAGDELTEKIAQHYLVDFNTGEKIKTSLSGKSETITFVDILGIKQTVKCSEVLEVLKPTIELLTKTIADRILEFNHKAPNAVFLIGGGSQIPGLVEHLTSYLNLGPNRVVVRGREIIQSIKFTGNKLAGPEAITPFGIAVTALMQKGQDFMSVTINGQKVRLFNSKKLTVADALILIGFNPGQLIGRTGKSVTFYLNGQKKVVRGEYGKSAEIFVNEQSANLETVLKIGDHIRVIPAEDGKNAKVLVSDYINCQRTGFVALNGSQFEMGTQIYINGKRVDTEHEIAEGDQVEVCQVDTLGEFLKLYEIEILGIDTFVNGNPVDLEYLLESNDSIELKKTPVLLPEENCEITAETITTQTQVDAIETMEESQPTPITEGTKIADIIKEDMETQGMDANKEDGKTQWTDTHKEDIEAQGIDTYKEDVETQITEARVMNETIQPHNLGYTRHLKITVNGEEKDIESNTKQFIFVDIFNYIHFDLSSPKGNIILKLNGNSAGFTDTIQSGDIIDIYWEN